MINKVHQNLAQHLQSTDTVIFGISGGIDSMSLLQLLIDFQTQTPFQLILAHINHQLRDQDSDQDQKLITKTAKKHNLKLEIHSENVAALAGSLETNAREVRYSFFEKLRKKYSPPIAYSLSSTAWIITAHHANDSLETVIMNFARGTASRGLCGIQLKRDHFLRPLFNITRTEIETYATENQITFREDLSNNDLKFNRNFIRHEIIPQLKRLNPNIEKTFLDNQEYWINLHQFHQQTAENWIKQNQITPLTFPAKNYQQLPPALQTDILSHLYSQLYNSTQNLNTAHLNQIQKILNQNTGNTKKEFGPNHWITKKSGTIKIIPQSD